MRFYSLLLPLFVIHLLLVLVLLEAGDKLDELRCTATW
jgi:hypothetical protein